MAIVPAKRMFRAGIRSSNFRTGGFLGIENKFLDLNLIGSAINITWVGGEEDPAGVDALNAIAQGDGESNRDGRKCVLTQVNVAGRVTFAPGAAVDGRVVRVMLIWDTQSNGAQLNAEDVMVNTGNISQQFRNLQFSKRFRVLADKKFTFSQTALGTIMEKQFHIFKKLPNIQVIHNGTTGNISTITDNSLHMIACASGTLTSLSYNSRVRFRG